MIMVNFTVHDTYTLPAHGSITWMMITAVMVVLPQEVSRVTLAAFAALAFALLLLVPITFVTQRRFGTLSPVKLMKGALRGVR